VLRSVMPLIFLLEIHHASQQTRRACTS
jgi:hypothetical protein